MPPSRVVPLTDEKIGEASECRTRRISHAVEEAVGDSTMQLDEVLATGCTITKVVAATIVGEKMKNRVREGIARQQREPYRGDPHKAFRIPLHYGYSIHDPRDVTQQ